MPAVYPLKITTKVEEMAAGDYLAVDAGGTGQVVYAVGDMLIASSTTALSRLTAGPLNSVLTMGATLPQWSAPAAAAAGALTGATLAAGVTASSLTSLGAIAALIAGTGTFSAAVVTAGTLSTTKFAASNGIFQISTSSGSTMQPYFLLISEGVGTGMYGDVFHSTSQAAATGFSNAAYYLNASRSAGGALTTGNLLALGNAGVLKFIVDINGSLILNATNKIHFNGVGGDSYIQEAGAGVLYVVSGNILSFAARAGIVTIGSAISTSCTAGDLSFVHGRGIRAGNTAATDTIHVMSHQTTGSVEAIVIGGARPVVIGSMSAANTTTNTLALTNATAPSANPTGGGFAYAEAGALKWRGSAGTVTTVAPA